MFLCFYCSFFIDAITNHRMTHHCRSIEWSNKVSPEQAQEQPADARSDIFSFGLVLYEMLSGRRAFSGENNPAIMAALLRDEPAPLQTSPSLEKILRRCLAKQASSRYQTISEVKAALEQVFGKWSPRVRGKGPMHSPPGTGRKGARGSLRAFPVWFGIPEPLASFCEGVVCHLLRPRHCGPWESPDQRYCIV